MKLTQIKTNMVEVEFSGNLVMLFSYKTPVAAMIRGGTFYRTDKKLGNTTTRHINLWLEDIDKTLIETKPQEFFDNLIKDKI